MSGNDGLGAGGTDRDRWMAFFAQYGIPVETGVEGAPEGTLRVSALNATTVVGYNGFYMDITFDAAGTFTGVALLE